MASKKKSAKRKRPITSEFNAKMENILRRLEQEKKPQKIEVLHDFRSNADFKIPLANLRKCT